MSGMHQPVDDTPIVHPVAKEHDLLSVPCPWCGYGVGEPCRLYTWRKGKGSRETGIRNGVHPSRARAYWKAEGRS